MTKAKLVHATALIIGALATITGTATSNPATTKAGAALVAFLVGLAGLYVKPPHRKTPKRPRGEPKPFIMADGVNANGLPSGLTAYAGYVAGAWPSRNAILRRFPRSRVLNITPNAAVIPSAPGALDVEQGDAAVSQVTEFVRECWRRGIKRVRIYCEISEVAPIRAALAADRIPRTAVLWWIAHPNGMKHICGPSTCGAIPFDADATQYYWTTGYDLSYCRGNFLDD